LFDKFIEKKVKKRTTVVKEAKQIKIPKHQLTEDSPMLTFHVVENKVEKKKYYKASCTFLDKELYHEIQNKNCNKTQACHTLLREILKVVLIEYKDIIESKGIRISIQDTRFRNILKKAIDEYDTLYANINKAVLECDIEKVQMYQEMERNLVIAQALFNVKYQII